jgi:hypothetical protein
MFSLLIAIASILIGGAITIFVAQGQMTWLPRVPWLGWGFLSGGMIIGIIAWIYKASKSHKSPVETNTKKQLEIKATDRAGITAQTLIQAGGNVIFQDMPYISPPSSISSTNAGKRKELYGINIECKGIFEDTWLYYINVYPCKIVKFRNESLNNIAAINVKAYIEFKHKDSGEIVVVDEDRWLEPRKDTLLDTGTCNAVNIESNNTANLAILSIDKLSNESVSYSSIELKSFFPGDIPRQNPQILKFGKWDLYIVLNGDNFHQKYKSAGIITKGFCEWSKPEPIAN